MSTLDDTLAISGSPLSIPTASLPSGMTASVYSANVNATGGTGTDNWAATGLPAGLSINAATGAINGTPTSSGNFTVVITATDSSSPPVAASIQLALEIAPVPAAPSPSPTPDQNPSPSPTPPANIPATPAPAPVVPAIAAILTTRTPVSLVVIDSTKVVLGGAKSSIAPIVVTCKTATCSGSARMTTTITVRETMRVKQGKKTVSKVVLRRITEVLASASFKLARGKSTTVFLQLSATGQSMLSGSAKHPTSEMLTVNLKTGKTVEQRVVVS